ncbi:MAG: hypothetical protein U0414_10595 [Polyangiaceae bacterium]
MMASEEGSFDLELRDGEDLVDSLTRVVHGRAGRRAPPRQGGRRQRPRSPSSTSPSRETAILAPTFVDAAGAELASGVAGDARTFADESIARQGSSLNLIFGPWNGLVVDGIAAGTTTSSIPGIASTLALVVE